MISSILVISLSALNQKLWAQSFGDQSFYLVDSLDLTAISEETRTLLDTSFTLYHNAQDDTTRLSLLEHIVDQCWEEFLWPQYNQMVYDQASYHLKLERNPLTSKKYASLLAGSISNLGYIADNISNVPVALNYYHQALRIYEQIGDREGAASSFNNLGVLYSAQGDTSKAMYYHNESLRLKKIIGDQEGIAVSLNNIGTIYKDKGRIFEALDCFEKSLRIARELDDRRSMAIAYDNIAGVYFTEGYEAKAIDFYTRAYDIRIINGEYTGASFSLNNISRVYFALNNIDKAFDYAKRSFELASELGFPIDIQNAAASLTNIYKRKNDYKNALFYFEIQVQMSDSIYNDNNERAMLSQSLRYEFEKETLKKTLQHQKEQAVKDLQISQRDAEISKERMLSYSLIIGLVLMVYLVYISVRNYRRKQRDNELIQQQKNEVENQKQKIEKQHHILEETYKEISDSITYAKRIQQAILPPADLISNSFSDAFVWYQPKNVVSGDFFWYHQTGDDILLAVADCTGHGVPGAMVSVVCHNAMNRAVLEFGLQQPDLVLNKTRDLVIETFDKSGSEVKDGMDISLIHVNTKTNLLQYAGANNNLYLIRHGLRNDNVAERIETALIDEKGLTFYELKADKQPIGRFSKAKPFNLIRFALEKNDQLYLFSDGLADQFGGPKGKKFKYAQIKEILFTHASHAMLIQNKALLNGYESWKGELEQVDDICFIGIRI
ncbi:MAG: tetratricopeptide repeat protein [Crocinitomicaceae bacterium]|nr:tetratricopeptide repeat protein [Crocinitomicaceae bacterium]MBK8924925.1 tetratricopeptide repeat protein [Crocinitomicaceae bacterium]